MTRYSTFFGVVSALAFGIAVPAFADSQLAASAGLTADEAATMSLTEIAAVKFNRETRADDQQTCQARLRRDHGFPVDACQRLEPQPAGGQCRPVSRRSGRHDPDRDRGGEVQP